MYGSQVISPYLFGENRYFKVFITPHISHRTAITVFGTQCLKKGLLVQFFVKHDWFLKRIKQLGSHKHCIQLDIHFPAKIIGQTKD